MAGAWVGFYPGGVRGVDRGEVFEEDVFDDVRGRGWVAEGADAGGAGFVAGYVFDVYVCAVAFDGDAVLKDCK